LFFTFSMIYQMPYVIHIGKMEYSLSFLKAVGAPLR